MIQLFKTYIHPESKDNVLRVLDSGWVGLGPETEAFEKEVASYLGVKYAIAMNSCTEALRIAIRIASKNVKQGYVVTTPNTFVSSNSTLVQNDLFPVFGDIDYHSGNLSLESARDALKKYHCGLIMLVHYGGYPPDIDRFQGLAEEHGIEIIHDCAHAFGSIYKGKKVGYNIKYACFSFHAVKPLATGDGGMLVTSSEEVAEVARKLRWFGINKSTAQRTNIGDGTYGWEYDVEMLGWKSHMNDITAAIGRGQLLHYDEDFAKRESLANRYRKNLLSSNVRPIDTTSINNKSSNHLFVVLFESFEDRHKAMKRLSNNNIQYGYHYKPTYKYKDFKEYPIVENTNMERFYKTALSLPMHLYMTEQDVDTICECIMEEK